MATDRDLVLVCGVNARHYEVISDEMYSPPWGLDPPEWWRCWGFYLAKNKRDARLQAVKDSEFSEWVDEMRSSGMPPFKGLEVKPFLCPHGRCLGCFEEGRGCEACDYEAATGEPHDWTLALLGAPPNDPLLLRPVAESDPAPNGPAPTGLRTGDRGDPT